MPQRSKWLIQMHNVENKREAGRTRRSQQGGLHSAPAYQKCHYPQHNH